LFENKKEKPEKAKPGDKNYKPNRELAVNKPYSTREEQK